MDIQIGDVVTLKKQHPCGSKEWEVLRVGMDFRLKCMGCDHQVMIPRKQVEKNIRQIVKAENKAEYFTDSESESRYIWKKKIGDFVKNVWYGILMRMNCFVPCRNTLLT